MYFFCQPIGIHFKQPIKLWWKNFFTLFFVVYKEEKFVKLVFAVVISSKMKHVLLGCRTPYLVSKHLNDTHRSQHRDWENCVDYTNKRWNKCSTNWRWAQKQFITQHLKYVALDGIMLCCDTILPHQKQQSKLNRIHFSIHRKNERLREAIAHDR